MMQTLSFELGKLLEITGPNPVVLSVPEHGKVGYSREIGSMTNIHVISLVIKNGHVGCLEYWSIPYGSRRNLMLNKHVVRMEIDLPTECCMLC